MFITIENEQKARFTTLAMRSRRDAHSGVAHAATSRGMPAGKTWRTLIMRFVGRFSQLGVPIMEVNVKIDLHPSRGILLWSLAQNNGEKYPFD